jgi:vitamin B12 transporter
MSQDVSAKLFLKSIFSFFIVNVFFFSFANTNAEDVIVITADRIKSNTNKSTSDVRIINADEIKKSSIQTLPELLSKESDLSVVSSGPNGSNSSLFIRGSDSSHTLVVIDGIVMNDPSNPNRQFDIGRLSLNNIGKIEILKGSQGLAYGSNAIGGVIVITTKKAQSNQVKGESYLDYGTFNTVNAGTNFQKKYELLNLSAGLDFMKTDGFSAANKKDNPNAELDGDQRVALSLAANKEVFEDLVVDFNLHYSHNASDLDKAGGAGNDDPNDRNKEEEIYSKIQFTKDWSTGNAETKFAINHSTHFRLTEVLYDTANPASSATVSKGEINSFNANHTYYINESFTQNLNLEFSHEKDQSKHFNQNFSGFLYHQLELPTSIFNFGLRLDHNKIYNDHVTYKLAAGRKFEFSLLKLSYSTGFRAPSLNQIYDPNYGNKNLIPETSQSSDLSLENRWAEEFKTTSTLFYTHLKDRLGFTPVTYVNRNSGKAEMMGLEESASMNWNQEIDQVLSLTLLKTRNLSESKKLERRPDVNLKNTFFFSLKEKHHFDYELSYTGKKSDVDNLGNTVQMDSYLLSNLSYRFEMNVQSEVYFKIKNVFNLEYEEIFGYGTGGRAMTAGMKYSF